MSGDGLPKLRNKIKSDWPIELATPLYTLNIKLVKFKECQKKGEQRLPNSVNIIKFLRPYLPFFGQLQIFKKQLCS